MAISVEHVDRANGTTFKILTDKDEEIEIRVDSVMNHYRIGDPVTRVAIEGPDSVEVETIGAIVVDEH